MNEEQLIRRLLAERVSALETSLGQALGVIKGIKDGSIPLERVTVHEDRISIEPEKGKKS